MVLSFNEFLNKETREYSKTIFFRSSIAAVDANTSQTETTPTGNPEPDKQNV